MEQRHIDLLASSTKFDLKAVIRSYYEGAMNIDKVPILLSEALTALQALETALTEKHRAEVDEKRNTVWVVFNMRSEIIGMYNTEALAYEVAKKYKRSNVSHFLIQYNTHL